MREDRYEARRKSCVLPLFWNQLLIYSLNLLCSYQPDLNLYSHSKAPESEMGFFGNAKRRKELSAAVNTLREQEIQVTGPYRRPNGMLVFSVGNSVVTEAELLQLHRNGDLRATLPLSVRKSAGQLFES